MRGWGLPLRSCVLLLFSGPLYSYHTAACCPHKRQLCSCFTCADYSLCLEYSSLRYAHGFLLHFLQVFYSERLAQVPPKNPAPSPLSILLDFSPKHTSPLDILYLFICSLYPAGEGKLTSAGALPARLLSRHFGQCSAQGRC